jgi:hypothetical protein
MPLSRRRSHLTVIDRLATQPFNQVGLPNLKLASSESRNVR